VIIQLEEEFTVTLSSEKDEGSWGDMLLIAADYLKSHPDLEVAGLYPSSTVTGKALRVTLKRLQKRDPHEAD
jgi:hypothetical protein